MITIDNLNKPSAKVLFVSGIDTNVGKTVATAALANSYIKMGYKTITQKFIQTGCDNTSEDILSHRQLMHMPMLDIDLKGETCPIIFSYPSSPHLASQIDGKVISLDKIEQATDKLSNNFDVVLLEGAGGLMVPVFANGQQGEPKGNYTKLGGYLTIDYVKEHNYPVVLVTSGKLGSLNHTLLSIEACQSRNIKIEMIIYNLYPNTDQIIINSSLEYLRKLNIPVVVLDVNE